MADKVGDSTPVAAAEQQHKRGTGRLLDYEGRLQYVPRRACGKYIDLGEGKGGCICLKDGSIP